MKTKLQATFLLFILSTGMTVIMEPTGNANFNHENMSLNEAFGECLAKKEYGTLECVNRGALSKLQSLNEQDELDFGNIRLERAEGYGRDLLDFDYDPRDFGNVVKAAAKLMERRSIKWQLDGLYPGLQMQVGPMLNGNGVLEFVLNEQQPHYNDRQSSTGRQLARHLLLPLLLGFKFNLASLIPLLFGLLILVTKKALFLTKISLAISGLLGWNSLLSSFHGYQQGPFNDHIVEHERPIAYPDHYVPLRPYRTIQAHDFGQHVIREVLNVYDVDNDERQSARSGKNFAWAKSD